MSKVIVHSFSVSLDGYSAGPNQDIDHPLGVDGIKVLRWQFVTKTHRLKFGAEDGTTGIDDDIIAQSFEGIGAWILGRNMFGPIRGPWLDDEWKGWWGDDPVYHNPVFVLTNYARDPIVMEGGTTFYFVTDGIHAALERAKEAANGKDVRIGGGVSTINQYLEARLIDEMHYAVCPTLLGSGERLFGDLNLPNLGYEVTEHFSSPNVMHVRIGRRPDAS